ncbi:MAG: segregation/condensation protein A [Candidatus Omnitrophota bacterium]|jgi:segregation and condensation protein A
MSYKVRLELFEGPLDLLLYLVKKDHLNIYDIPIAQVTEQYLKYLELMKLLDLGIAGDFLVMAATLMEIKSKMLLPAEQEEERQEEQEDPRAELVRRLLEYEKFKKVADELKERESLRMNLFKRARPLEKEEISSGEDVKGSGEGYFEASIFDLISAFSKAMQEVPKEMFYEVIKDEFTVEDKIHHILHLLLVKQSTALSGLFAQARNKVEIAVTFLAILELVRMKEIVAVQRGLFEEIEVVRNSENIIPYDRAVQTENN